jgi:hypothetical protein
MLTDQEIYYILVKLVDALSFIINYKHSPNNWPQDYDISEVINNLKLLLEKNHVE